MTQGAVKTKGKRSRAVSAKKKAILSAALDTFSQFGFHGTRLEQIAELAGVSKTNLLYYFPSKEALYIAVLRQILDIWLAPLKAFREDFAPLAAIKEYIRLKLEVSRDYPQASRLFCMEMLAGAPLLMDELTGDLKALIDEKSALIAGWVKSGKLAPIDPQHLIFMIWASTQHYRSNRRLPLAFCLYPAYSDRNTNTISLSAPETSCSGFGIRRFFHCHSSADENPTPLPQKAGYGYHPADAGSVRRIFFLRGCVCSYQKQLRFPGHVRRHLYGSHP